MKRLGAPVNSQMYVQELARSRTQYEEQRKSHPEMLPWRKLTTGQQKAWCANAPAVGRIYPNFLLGKVQRS